MPTDRRIPPEILAAWERGDKIGALRALRAGTGLGLKEAKAALESGADTVRAPERATHRTPGLAPGEVPRGAFSWTNVITLVGAVAVVALLAVRFLRP